MAERAQVTLDVQGMTCDGCAAHVEKALHGVPGVEDADAAGEVIQAATLAVKFGLRVQDLVDAFHPYLTMAEGLNLTALTFDKDVAKLSCCAA